MLRNVGFGVAVALGAVGIWLIVAGGSTQRVEIGVLAGLWGLLLGAICGRRLVVGETPPPPAEPPQAAAPMADAVREQTAIALREVVEMERADVAAARRAFEAEFASLLRQEVATAVNSALPAVVDAAVNREIGELRAEIQQLRQELLEKVGGQLRLERIETTRLIGSDLEAMRAEFRRLKQAEESAAVTDGGTMTNGSVANGAADRTVIEAEPVPTPPAPPAQPPRSPQPPAAANEDPFASLPRLTPFVDDTDDLLAGADASHTAAAQPDEERGYAGRRRRAEHSQDGEDVLARLLARERVRH